MQYAAELADPLVNIRDVLESFRSNRVVTSDWDQSLRRAVLVLSQLPPQAQVETVLPGLLLNLRRLQTEGLDGVPALVETVARQVAAALENTRIRGLPSPEDDDWSFGAG
jgi:hypothetical protein